MASHPSSRSGSHPAVDVHAALPFILEHVLTYPERYKINTGKKGSKNVTAGRAEDDIITSTTTTNTTTAIPEASRTIVEASEDQADDKLEQAGTLFKNLLIRKITMSPSQPFTLPPSYVMDFVRGVFTEDLCLVDFTQALTALDYLKDLEGRRRKEMTEALERLGVPPPALDAQKETLKKERPAVADWVAGIVTKAKRIESLYTQVYIGLRRWTLINEMRLEPFNKPNCIAMLNNLYPATYSTPPTSQLTPTLLNSQRNAFFRYILAVESNGKSVLQKLEQQGKRPADANAWPIVRDIVDKYLRTANNLIQDCSSVICEEDITSTSAIEKRTDSGVSFASTKSSGGLSAHDVHPAHRPASNTQEVRLEVPNASTGGPKVSHHRKGSSTGEISIVRADTLRHKEVRKVGSTLERLARELKRMRSRSNEGRGDALYGDRPRSRSRGASGSEGMLPPPPMTATAANFPDLLRDDDDHIMPLPSQSRQRGLKKMKSTSNITTGGAISREHAIGNLKQGLNMERKGSAQSQTSVPHLHPINTGDRSFSVSSNLGGGEYMSMEEQRRTLLARARAEREALGTHPSERRHSPLEERVGAFLAHGSPSSVDDISLDIMAHSPVRKSSPGRNKLRDYYGVPSVDLPTPKYGH